MQTQTLLNPAHTAADGDDAWLKFTFFQPNQELPLTWLDTSELHWLQGKSAKRAATFAWSRALLRQLCCEKLHVAPTQVMISLPAADKTILKVAGKTLFCSVSHSQQLVAVLVSQIIDIGLDVEQMSPLRDQRPYADIYPALQQYCESSQQFYQRWTALEASIKLKGGQLFELLTQQNPQLASNLRHWQQQDYQFCVASELAINTVSIQQLK